MLSTVVFQYRFVYNEFKFTAMFRLLILGLFIIMERNVQGMVSIARPSISRRIDNRQLTKRSIIYSVQMQQKCSTTIQSSAFHTCTRQRNLELCSTSQSSSSSSSYTRKEYIDNDTRAGMEGYSVLRRPVTWDPNTDPEFDIPTQRTESGYLSNDNDNQWWSNRKEWVQKQGGSQQSTTVAAGSSSSSTMIQKRNNGSILDNAEEEASQLNLFQRTLDTLDFYRVTKALQDECMTVPAQLVTQQARGLYGEERQRTTVSKGYNEQQRIEHEIAYQPLMAKDVTGCQERYRAVEEITWLLQGGTNRYDKHLDDYTWRNRLGYQQPLAGRPAPLDGNSFNLEAILERTSNGQRVLEGYEILEISDMMDTMSDIVLWNLKGLQKVTEDGLEFIELPKIANCITVNETLQELLHNAFEDEQKNSGGNQQRRLSGKRFPKIGELRAKIRNLKSDIMSTLNRLVALPAIKSNLALDGGGALISEVGGSTNGGNGGRLVIPVNAQYASKVGIVHDSSRSGKTVYCEPTDIVEPTNRMRQAEGELRIEEARVWRMLTEQILVNKQQLQLAVAAIGQLDLAYARYSLGQRMSGVVPVVMNEGVIALQKAKHPVLVLRESVNVVGSDISLGVGMNQGLVLTGPNAGGKTVVLKLLGLVALMARCGIPVPAAPSTNGARAVQVDADTDDNSKSSTPIIQPRVDFFDPVLADIGDLQSVGSDLSTFSGHMLVCREVLNTAGQNALVLMDELGSGTDPAQGVAIAQALLEALVSTGARVAITTHYMQLKQLAASDDRFDVAGMQFVRGQPTYRLLPGTVGESFALAVAERLQLPRDVIDRATELLDSETRQMGDLLRDLELQKELVEEQGLLLQGKRKELEIMEIAMKEEQLKMEKKQLNIRREEAKKFAAKLQEKEQVLEDILERLKSDPSRRIVAKSWDEIKLIKREAFKEAERFPRTFTQNKQDDLNRDSDEQRVELISLDRLDAVPELKVNDKLVVCKDGPMYGKEAVVIKVMGNKLEVRVSNMSVVMKLSQLALVHSTMIRSVARSEKSTSKDTGTAISKAAERAIASERSAKPTNPDQSLVRPDFSSGVAIRTESNTVDVLGCNLVQAQDRIMNMISTSLVSNRKVIYILHGHGSSGLLKTKIRTWLKQEQTVKRFAPADRADGGDAFTRIDLG